MPKKRHQSIRYAYLFLSFIFVLIILAVFWLYSGTLTPGKIKIFQTVPLPMALVNWHPLPMKDFLIRYGVNQKVLAKNNNQEAKTGIFKQMVLESEVSQLAAQRDALVSQKQIDQEYLTLSAQTNLQGQPDFEKYLQSQGLTESIFKNNIIKPGLLLNQLQIWFNSQPNLNPTAYDLANKLLAQINSGNDMAALAREYTEDSAGKSTGGDMGFVQITDLSQELRESASALKPGETKIIPGLEGLYIVRLEDQTGNQLHLREIYLKTADFNAWLSTQTQNFKVINLLSI